MSMPYISVQNLVSIQISQELDEGRRRTTQLNSAQINTTQIKYHDLQAHEDQLYDDQDRDHQLVLHLVSNDLIDLMD